MTEIVRLPVPASTGADEDTQAKRNQRLFDWALEVLKQLGLDQAVAQAKSIQELAGVMLNLGSAAIDLAIRDALHPAVGERQSHFKGLNADSLKRIIKNRFTDLKKDRDAILRRAGRKGSTNWEAELDLDDDGEIRPILSNLILILRYAPKWVGVLAFDEFAARVVIRKTPPWGAEPIDAPWTDHFEILTRVWFQREAKINPAAGDVGRAVQAAARHNLHHPVRDYLNALVWDGTPRLDTWLVAYFHAEDSAYIRAVGPRWLISAVARIYQPGCQADHTPIFEGPQGKLKTESLRALPVKEAWFSDRLSHMASKDAAIEVAGVWLFEIAEMDALTRASPSTAKAFLTRRHDRYRPPHGKHTIRTPRQCVFAGTINPPVGGYLKDPTGARRFWPVACPGMIDRAGIERDRDQLWAEAVARYKAGAPWWLEKPELEALAAAEQAARFVVDAWEAPIREWLVDRIDVGVTEVLEHALGFPREAWTQVAQNRAVKILTHLGFSRHRPRTPDRRPNRYWHDPVPAKNRPLEGDHPDRPDHERKHDEQ